MNKIYEGLLKVALNVISYRFLRSVTTKVSKNFASNLWNKGKYKHRLTEFEKLEEKIEELEYRMSKCEEVSGEHEQNFEEIRDNIHERYSNFYY